jgi:CheY-like chemotaxis protein
VPLRVLLLEDDLAVQQLVATLLARRGHDVSVASTAADAAAFLADADRPFDMMLIDVGLPDMDGITFTERLSTRCPGTRVVYMTGWLDGPLFDRMQSSGATVLLKPFTTAALIKAVEPSAGRC